MEVPIRSMTIVEHQGTSIKIIIIMYVFYTYFPRLFQIYLARALQPFAEKKSYSIMRISTKV